MGGLAGFERKSQCHWCRWGTVGVGGGAELVDLNFISLSLSRAREKPDRGGAQEATSPFWGELSAHTQATHVHTILPLVYYIQHRALSHFFMPRSPFPSPLPPPDGTFGSWFRGSATAAAAVPGSTRFSWKWEGRGKKGMPARHGRMSSCGGLRAEPLDPPEP